jgi:hypothetical protein
MKALERRAKRLISKFEISFKTGDFEKDTFTLDYEDRQYRDLDLAKLILKAVPLFALTQEEYRYCIENELSEMQSKAWSRISKAVRTKKCDYGEILLFLLLKFFYNNQQVVTKIRLKTNDNEQIKGYDCANFTIENGKVVLWLGEVKFYKYFSKAVDDIIEELMRHTQHLYIKKELKILNLNCEINKDNEFSEEIEDIISRRTSLDKVKIIFPALITYNSAFINKHGDIDSKEFKDEATKEFKKRFELIDEK